MEENISFIYENVSFVGENVSFMGENVSFMGEKCWFMDENCSGAGTAGRAAGAGADRRNEGTWVGTGVGACVGQDWLGTSKGPVYRSYG